MNNINIYNHLLLNFSVIIFCNFCELGWFSVGGYTNRMLVLTTGCLPGGFRSTHRIHFSLITRVIQFSVLLTKVHFESQLSLSSSRHLSFKFFIDPVLLFNISILQIWQDHQLAGGPLGHVGLLQAVPETVQVNSGSQTGTSHLESGFVDNLWVGFCHTHFECLSCVVCLRFSSILNCYASVPRKVNSVRYGNTHTDTHIQSAHTQR